MKFLLECVSCYGTPSPDDSSDSVSVFPSSSALRRRSRSLSRPDWKPSLYAISEDNAVQPVKPKNKAPDQMNRASSARRSERRCASSSPRLNPRRRDDTYGRDHVQMIVLAFAPTPFMF